MTRSMYKVMFTIRRNNWRIGWRNRTSDSVFKEQNVTGTIAMTEQAMKSNQKGSKLPLVQNTRVNDIHCAR